MKSARLIRVSLLAALFSAVAAGISAQNVALPTTASGQTETVSGFIGVSLGGPAALTGAPYTATRKTTRVQTLANGTTVTHVTTVKEARDSQGRTYREEHFDTPAADQQPMIHYVVFDPVARTMMNWSSREQTVTLNHLPEPRQNPRVQNRIAQAPRLTTPPVSRLNQSNFQIEDLGTKNIEGVEAVGRRTTRTIPAGQEGNDQPITITHESWTSPELRVTIQENDDDPRSGTTTMELTDIDRNEPDPRLFQAPEGYTVREIEPAQPRVVDTNP